MDLRIQVAKLGKLGIVILLALSAAYGLLLIGVRLRESFVRSRSEAIYAEFLKLRLGGTTQADIEVLRRRFAGSLTESGERGVSDCEYTIGNVWGYSRWFQLTQLAHDHMPSSQLTLKCI